VDVTARRIITSAGSVGPGRVRLDGSRIDALEAFDGEVPDRTLVPGFVDLQVNGWSDVAVWEAEGDEWDVLGAALLEHGITTWCPTLTTGHADEYPAALDRIERAMGSAAGPTIAGAHLEGPLVAGRPGAHDASLAPATVPGWLLNLPPVVRVVTLGLEAANTLELVAHLAGQGRVVALGHTEAGYEQALEAIDAGATMVTHLFNAMAPLHHREPGLVGAALDDERVCVSAIADLVHLHPAVLRLAQRQLGGRLVVVSDAVGWAREGFERRDGAAWAADGTLVGSATLLDGALRNLVQGCGLSLESAVHAAATSPAAVLDLADRGRIEPGARADLVALDPDLRVEAVWQAGRQVFAA